MRPETGGAGLLLHKADFKDCPGLSALSAFTAFPEGPLGFQEQVLIVSVLISLVFSSGLAAWASGSFPTPSPIISCHRVSACLKGTAL